jgi:hypothetical protein
MVSDPEIAKGGGKITSLRLEANELEKLERLAEQFTRGNRSELMRLLIQEAQVLEIKTKGVIVELVANE